MAQTKVDCRAAKLGCVECKKMLADADPGARNRILNTLAAQGKAAEIH